MFDVLEKDLQQVRETESNLTKKSAVEHTQGTILDFLAEKEVDLNSLGAFGKSLDNFRSKVDIDHPYLHEVHEGVLLKGGNLYSALVDAVESSDFGDVKFQKDMTVSLNKTFEKTRLLFDKPPTCLVKAQADRQATRNMATPLRVFLKDVLKDNGAWIKHPSSFLAYTRFNTLVEEEAAYWSLAYEKLKKHYLHNHAKFVESELQKLKETQKDQHHGFVRLGITNAALILAKAHGFHFKDGFVCARHKNYSHPFWLEHKDVKSNKTDIFPGDIFTPSVAKKAKSKGPVLSYAADVYPIDKVPFKRSEAVNALVKQIDEHPDFNFKPMFDQFWVMVPSFNLSSFNDGEKDYTMPSMHADSKPAENEAAKWEYFSTMDKYLVESGFATPIIMGENRVEGKCYFISYWH